jgi:hypothetical protein
LAAAVDQDITIIMLVMVAVAAAEPGILAEVEVELAAAVMM